MQKDKVVAKLDNNLIHTSISTDSVISITFPSNINPNTNHALDINYTVYATDNNGQVLEEKNKFLTQTIKIITGS